MRALVAAAIGAVAALAVMTSYLPWGFLGLGAAPLALALLLEARSRGAGPPVGPGQLDPAPDAAPVNA
jgi:hypothetical protein